MKMFACILAAIFATIFGLIAFGGWYMASISIRAGDMFVERVTAQPSGPDQIAAIAYSEDFCHIELPLTLEYALTKYQKQFPAEYDEAVTKLYKVAVDGGEDLQEELCRISRNTIHDLKGLP